MKAYFPPPDKSITVRALLLAAAASGESEVCNPLLCDDTEAALSCLSVLGVKTERLSDSAGRVRFKISGGISAPRGPLDAGGSGTTARLFAGLMAGSGFAAVIDGGAQLRRRPMHRIVKPLSMMGARIRGTGEDDLLPVSISPSSLHGIEYVSPVASAQVKSTVLLAGLKASGPTVYYEPYASRDHTERLLKYMGADIRSGECSVRIKKSVLHGAEITVPGDISSASFFIAGALLRKTELRVNGCGLNGTRCGFISVLKKMGADIEFELKGQEPEPFGDIIVKPSVLSGIKVRPDMIPSMIDEIPLLALVAASAEGKTVIEGINELAYKESDRIRSTLRLLRAVGAEAFRRGSSLAVRGGTAFRAVKPVECFSDHRIAMTAAVAGLAAGGLVIKDGTCCGKSYRGFFEDFSGVFG